MVLQLLATVAGSDRQHTRTPA